MSISRDFTSERTTARTAHDHAAFQQLANDLRAASWDISLTLVSTAVDRKLIPSLANLERIHQLANLPSFIGGLAMTIMRPAPGPQRSANPVLVRIARDHVIARETAGFTAREILQEFLLLRRVMWLFIKERIDQSLSVASILYLEDLLNSILDEVITECTVTYFDRATYELNERSRRDSLTGLLNHQAFNARLDEEIERIRRYGGDLQVIYFDLDDFKLINDELGHQEGDKALIGIAQIMRESIRDTDFAGRIGGDEFVICLVETTDMAAHLLLDRLRMRISEAVARKIIPEGTAISAGCAGLPREAETAQDLLVLADRRLYEDKRSRKSVKSSGVSEVSSITNQKMNTDPSDPALASSDNSIDPETERIVAAARKAIDEAKRRSHQFTPIQD